MSKIYRCSYCGETTRKKNEYQCPSCLTTDSLEEFVEKYEEDESDIGLEDLSKIFAFDE